MKAFIYKDEAYIRCVPGKRLFQSTMVHEVVNRGDIFAIRVSDQLLTIIPGTAEVEHYEMLIYERGMEPISVYPPAKQAEPTAQEIAYLITSCTEPSCSLCATPIAMRKHGQRHAGLSVHSRKADSIARLKATRLEILGSMLK